MTKSRHNKSKVITLANTHKRNSEKWMLVGMVALSAGLYFLTNWLIFLKF